MQQIANLPFFYKSHSKDDNGGYPAVLPFKLYFDTDLKMFRQESSPELSKILDQVYKSGSLADGSISSESGRAYLDKVVAYLDLNFKFKESSRVLEVGFGSGVLLKELKSKGVKRLTGIEPGDHSRVDGLIGIRLINDFFPSAQIQENYDLVYSFFVLEHIPDPLSYLKSLLSVTSDDGKLIFGVPNCEPYLKEGDLSVFIHEHFSYFTRESISELVKKAEANVENFEIVEGAILVTVNKAKAVSRTLHDEFLAEDFYGKVDSHIEKLSHLFSRYRAQDLAIYAPIRAMNSLYLTGKTDLRLVDDNSELTGKYLPSLRSPVESFDQVATNPPKAILIFSRTFGHRIKTKCVADGRLRNTTILTLDDL